MIKDIGNSITKNCNKRNWIDQFGVVFGFDDNQQCCEDFGWAVYDTKTGEKICDTPNGLPYHFDFQSGPKEVTTIGKESENIIYGLDQFPYIDVLDCVQINLINDANEDKTLVFQCYTSHNGYYCHNFSCDKIE